MKALIFIVFVVSISSCSLNTQNDRFSNSSVQIVNLGKFQGLRSIQLASLNYPDSTTQTSQVFTDIDKENFSDSLIQSFKRSDVRVLPSAQTKIHIDITQLAMLKVKDDREMIISANVAVSRNGIITRKTLEIISESKITIGGTKDNGVKIFIQKLAELLREQSSFKR